MSTEITRSVTLRTGAGTELKLEKLSATAGADAFDIGALLAKEDLVTYDIGFANTAYCTSEITYIDGDAGILRYRGYPIEELARHSSFVEVIYLLLHGELPAQKELRQFADTLGQHAVIEPDVARMIDLFPRGSRPMSVLAAAVSALSTFEQQHLDPLDSVQVERSTLRLLAALPTIAAMIYKHSQGDQAGQPDSSLGLVENFLTLSFGQAGEAFDLDPVVVRALDLLLILHADHEQNCSTAAVRLTGSSQASLYSSVTAGIAALSGPLHGGANQSVLEMLEVIRADGGDVGSFVEKVKRKEHGVKLMGFGHRVYKNYDPRAAIIKKTADEVLSALGKRDELLDLALELESVALSDDYFISRKLYPNMDFYTGMLYRAMGFPAPMFTVLFAIGRLPGWIAQWREMINDPQTRIGRPRQLYAGPTQRLYVPAEGRARG
jgi:citrate synthase